MPRKIESLLLEGPAGQLEALLEEPEDRAPSDAALVCHPHPLYGGTLHNKVVHRLARGLRTSGAVVLRFNFRGVGRSAGEHDHGIGEQADALAALQYLRSRYPGLPYTVAGFSFGSRVAIKIGAQLDGVRRVIAVGFPTRREDTAYVQRCLAPKFFIHSTNDEHGPMDELERVVSGAPEPKQLIWVEASDHFFAGALDAFEQAVIALG